ncbi:MAG: type II toxin-antitoxin system RelE/ParE family toxin [Vicinamibacterales bacterium]
MKVVWFPRALNDISNIEHFIEQDNPTAARRVEQRIKGVVRLLGEHPHMGRPGRVSGTREFVVSGTPYIIAYTVFGDRVAILAVMHSSRQWPDGF